LGKGSSATVYEVTRIEDGKILAMKMIKYEEQRFTEKQKDDLKTEVRIMKQYKTPQIVNCIEAFDFKSCAFIILEKMHSPVTALSQSQQCPLTEPCVKYILY